MQLAHRLLSTRGGTFALACLATLLSAGAILAYLSRYRDSVNASTQPVTVLVAKSLIEGGTPGSVVGREKLFQATTLSKDDAKEGVITDPRALDGRVAAHDIYPDQQLTVADFTATDAGAIGLRLANEERAITVPVDGAHGMLGNIRAGDRVDVLAGFNVVRITPGGVPVDDGRTRPVLRTIMEDILVLKVPVATGGLGGGSTATNVTLQMSDRQATKAAFAADNGKVWLVLRPRTGGRETTTDIVTLETLLLGVKPVTALRSLGGRG